MGLIHARITLKNPRNTKIKQVTVEAPVVSGALHLCIPAHLQIQLEDMDLVVIPGKRVLEINPESPNVPSSIAKGFKNDFTNHIKILMRRC